jgi:thiamine pyrophosphokinase
MIINVVAGGPLRFGSTLCISNELNKNIGTYSFATGILMMVRSRDQSPI